MTKDGLLEEGLRLLGPQGVLTYSVCTVTREETSEVAESFLNRHREIVRLDLRGEHWRYHYGGGLVLPHDFGTDGMAIFQWKREK